MVKMHMQSRVTESNLLFVQCLAHVSFTNLLVQDVLCTLSLLEFFFCCVIMLQCL